MTATVTAASGFNLTYVWKGQGGRSQPERTAGGYYINAAQAGEAPGRWAGRGAEVLGFSAGQEVERGSYEAVYRQVHPVTGEQLGRRPGGYAKFSENLERLLAAEPHATAERCLELERQAAQATRKSPAYTDITVSFSKSISVLHASIRENARQARLAGDEAGARFWDAQQGLYQQILQEANQAGMDHLQRWAVTRTGYHGVRVGDQEPGKYESAGLVISSWLQGTSRDGDPQDHVHNQIARMCATDSDGKWRAVDTMAMRAQLGAVQGIVVAHAEAALSRAFGVSWVARTDGLGREIAGITQAQMDAYSSRTQAIKDKTPEAVAAWTAKYGRAPNRRELLHIQQEVTMATRAGKEPDTIDWDALAAKWDATLGGDLAQIAHDASGPGGFGAHTDPDAQPGAQGEAAQQEAAQLDQSRRNITVRAALSAVQGKHATWTRADLMREIVASFPPQAQQMTPQEAVALAHELTRQALSGAVEQVVCLDAPEYPAAPAYLMRDLDGRSIYTRPGTTRYATHVQLSHEEQLISTARQAGPVLEHEVSAGMLGTGARELEAAALDRAQEGTAVLPSGLRMDQGAALHQALTDPRTVSVIVGPAGSGKTRVLAEAVRMWQETGRAVIGLAPSQAARNVLAKAAQVEAYNTAQFLGHTQTQRGALGARELQPGTLILLDEGSMTSTEDIADIAAWAAAHGCKVVIAGDHGQLTAVEGGGGMSLLARELGHVQLAEPVRFIASWEREASLRLRAGDTSVLSEYDEHGRLRGGPQDEALEDARRAYVAGYLEGRDVLLMAANHETCRELSGRIRDDLMHLGLVDGSKAVQLREGVLASAGDLIVTRENDHAKGIANGDTWRISAIRDSGQVILQRLADADRDSGARQFEERNVSFDAFDTADLAYCVTGHTAQGRTVGEGHAVITGAEDREWAYVALSRGMFANIAHIITGTPRAADPKAPTRAAPELERHQRIERERAGLPEVPREQEQAEEVPERDYLRVLSDVMDRPGAELSAMETRDTNLSNADHLGKLHQVYLSEAAPALNARYEQLARQVLPPEFDGSPVTHTATWLWRSLRAAEAAGLDAGEVLGRAVERQSLAGSRDVWAVIDARVRDDTASMLPRPGGRWADRVPVTADEDRQEYLRDLAAAMDARKERLGLHTAETAPAWALRALGPVPDELLDRLDWEERASHVAAYRELFGYADAAEAIGPEPTADSPEKREAWHQAFAALGPVDGVDVRGLHDGQLHLMRGSYEAETAWAPRHVGEELRHVRLGAAEAEVKAVNAAALAQAARDKEQADTAARHEEHAASAQVMAQVYRAREEQLADAMTARHEWEETTRHARQLAIAADNELRRRHPEVKLDPVRSAEPEPVTDEQRLALDVPEHEPPAWLAEVAQQAERARDEAANRRSMRIPNEHDHELEDAGAAWPEMISRGRDAVLRPPRWEILPAPEVVRLAAERDAQQDAVPEAAD